MDLPRAARVDVHYVNDDLEDKEVSDLLYLRTGHPPVAGLLIAQSGLALLSSGGEVLRNLASHTVVDTGPSEILDDGELLLAGLAGECLLGNLRGAVVEVSRGEQVAWLVRLL